MNEIEDAGLVVALLFRNDPFHRWALEGSRKHSPFLTCDAVMAEVASFCPDPTAVLKLVMRGNLSVDPDFSLATEAAHLAVLAENMPTARWTLLPPASRA